STMPDMAESAARAGAEGASHGTQHDTPGRQAEVDGRYGGHLRDPEEPAERPRPAGPAEVRPGRGRARPVPRGTLTPVLALAPAPPPEPAAGQGPPTAHGGKPR